MTIRHLKIYNAVCMCGSMTKAADELHMTQPSISQAIKELERHYDVLLFNRVSKKLFITSAGEELLSYAKRILKLMDDVDESLSKKLDGPKTKIKIGCSSTIGNTFFAPLVSAFNKEHRNYSIYTIVDNAMNIEKMLENNDLDISIIAATNITSNILNTTSLLSDDLVFVYNNKYTIPNSTSIDIDELPKHPFILREKGSSIRDVVQKHIPDINLVGEYTTILSIIQAVKNNLGVSILPKDLVLQYNDKNLRFVNISHSDFKREYWIAHNINAENCDEINDFKEFCLRYILQNK